MKYMIMCGGISKGATTSKHLIKINGETIVSRTIRLLQEVGINDIAISTNTHLFDNLGVDVIYMDKPQEYWVQGFYISPEPTCYIYGDVYFSKEAIKTIIETPTKDIQFFASKPPFADNYYKKHAEPFAFKVEDYELFNKSLEHAKRLQDEGKFMREPIAWELWQVIKGTTLNNIIYTNYIAINDSTCDIDEIKDAEYYNG